MPPLLLFLRPARALPLRSQAPIAAKYQPLCLRWTTRRHITADEKPLPEKEGNGPGPNQAQLPHVSEEAAALGEVTGEGGPDIEKEGTPVLEVLDRDKKAEETKPEVLKDRPESKIPSGTRSFSTMSRRSAEVAMTISQDSALESQGHIFGLPELPIPARAHLKYRYEPIVQQVTGLIMKSGKLGVAQRNTAMILNNLRTASPPTINPNKPLVPGAPPASQLPLNPVLYMTLAIDSVAPLFRIRSQRGAAGGGVALQIPVPLTVRQRRRQAFMWILDAASKRRTRGSGRGGFAQKVAEELIAVIEGRSGVWDRRGGIHKLGVAARSNLNFKRRSALYFQKSWSRRRAASNRGCAFPITSLNFDPQLTLPTVPSSTMAGLAEELPKAVNPYKALSLSKTATAAEVKTAYKKLALKHHPDKVAPSARSSAHTKFQEIAFAYAILSDPTRRDRYDTTGSTSESVSGDFDWKSFFKAQFAEIVTVDKLNDLKSTYQGSEEEKRDVLEAYKRRKGNLTKMFKDIMLSNPLDDEIRFKVIIDAAVASGEVEPYDAYYNADPKERRDRNRRAQKEGREAQELAKELGVHDALFGSGAKPGQEKKGLADLIQQRQKARAATFLDDLTAKYVNGAGKNGVTNGKKRKSEETEEEDVPTTTAKSRKKGRFTKKGKVAKPNLDEYESECEEDDGDDIVVPPKDEPSEEAFQEVASRFTKKQKREVVEEDSDAEESLGDDTEEEADEDEESEEEVKPKRKPRVKPKRNLRKQAKRSKNQ